MSDLRTLKVLHSAISSLVLESGHTPLETQDGRTTVLCGQDRARANLSARQAKAVGSLTSGTFGPHGTISSESLVLQKSLESRLRQQTGVCGSTLYRLTWKESTTPSGRPLLQQQASALPRYVEEHTLRGWTTPVVADWNASRSHDPQGYSNRWKARKESGASLAHEAQAFFAGWNTPQASDGNGGKGPRMGVSVTGRMPDGSKVSMGLSAQAKFLLAGWRTPTCGSPNSLRGQGQDPEVRAAQGHTVNLQDQVRLVSFPSGAGIVQNMFSGETVASGQLNPEHSRWLMGLPAEWSYCMAMAMPLSRPKRKGSYVVSLRAKLRTLEFMCIRMIGTCEG